MPGLTGADLPTFSPARTSGRVPPPHRPQAWYFRLGPIPPWEASVTCFSAPHSPRRRTAASRPGRETLTTATAATRPPTLPPFFALPPSLARCRRRGPPAGNLLWTKSRYLRKKKRKDRLYREEGKRPKLHLFSCCDHWFDFSLVVRDTAH